MMMLKTLVSCAAMLCAGVAATGIYTADNTTVTPHSSTLNARRFKANFGSVAADGEYGAVEFDIVHLYGDAAERGYAHGQILADEILDLIEHGVPMFLKSLLEGLEEDADKQIPKFLQPIVHKLIEWAESNDQTLLNLILADIYRLQEDMVAGLPERLFVEMDHIGLGVCDKRPTHAYCQTKRFDLLTMSARVKLINFLPEMIKMTCTIVGAKDTATAAGTGLVQLRALDFGGGPFANSTTMLVHHVTDHGNDFVSVGFPSGVFVVTGWSTKIAISEKVWETYTGTGIQPGTYKGTSVALEMRHMLQSAESTAEAISFARETRRTFAVFLGVGDYNNNFNILGYREQDLAVFDDQSMPGVTKQQIIPDITYVDKHPQPTHAKDLPILLQSLHGNITGSVMASEVPSTHHTGDVHIAVYDFAAKQAFVSVGLTNTAGAYDDGMYAYQRPFLQFDMESLWAVPKP